MSRLLVIACAAALVVAPWLPRASAEEVPSFLQNGDEFCTSEADFNDLVAHGKVRAGSAIETCITIDRPTRVAVMSGQGGAKSMVRVISGPLAYEIGWTNGKLPLAK